MKKLLALAAAAVLAAVMLAGCSAKKAEIALVTDAGSVDDHSFNQSAWEGVVKYAEEKAISKQSFQPAEKSGEAYTQSLELAVKGGAKVVVCPGGLFAGPVKQAAGQHSDVAFIAVDCVLPEGTPDNAVGIRYAEEQAGFLAGYAAVREGMTSLGFLGAGREESVVKYGYGFVQGAEYAAVEMGLPNGGITIRYRYTQADGKSPENKSLAAGWYAGGTECIFVCGTDLTDSVIEAAQEAGAKVIGADVDQSSRSDAVVISATKGLSSSAYDMLTDFYNEEFPGGQNLVLDASSGGVALSMDSSRLETFTQKQYDTIYSVLANNTNEVASGLVGTPAGDGSVQGAGITLVKVALTEES